MSTDSSRVAPDATSLDRATPVLRTAGDAPAVSGLDVSALDDLDRRILTLLQTDCAMSNQSLAQRVHASPPTTLRRVRRLREEGFITREVAILDPQKFGSTLTAIVEITLDNQAAEHLDVFESRMLGESAVQQCYRVSTGPDFILVVQIPDMPAYHALAHRAFTAQAHVRNVRTFFATHRAKFDTRVLL